MGAEVNGRAELISQAEYARRRGVAKSAVAKAVAEGRISLINGKVDPSVADIQWAQNTRARVDAGRAGASSRQGEGQSALVTSQAASGPNLGQGGGEGAAPRDEYQDLRTQRERVALEREQRDNEREAGLLVRKDQVYRATFDAFRALRDAVMASPLQAAAKVVGMGDTREIERVISEELRRAIDAWEQQMDQRLKDMEN